MPDFDSLRERRWHKVDDPPRPTVLLEAFRRDPVANPLRTPSGRIEIFSATVEGFGDCRGHPAWYEPAEWLGGDRSRFGLHLLCHQPPGKLHSQLDHGAVDGHLR